MSQKPTRKKNESPWRKPQRPYAYDFNDESGRSSPMDDSLKNGAYLPYTNVKHTTAGE